jgi:hypothetical protein
MTIAELEFLLERGLSESLSASLDQPLAGYRPRVSLIDKSGRKKRHNAAADNWSPESGEIRITFEAEPESEPNRPVSTAAKGEIPPEVFADGLQDLVRHLDRAESRPGYNFVSLKWFRDSVLAAVRPEWANPEGRNRILREAIEARLVLTSKVPNPKSPEFPVTALRLNRSLPEVQAILGNRDTVSADFQPVAIRGEAISTTILRERR